MPVFPWKSSILSLCAIAIPFFFVVLRGVGREKRDEALGFLDRHRRALWVAWVFLFVLMNVVPLFHFGLPIPFVHDELSYMLGADTFAHGRWTNPPLPSWENFETFYVQHQPSYASIYPPGISLTLAAGRVIAGDAYWGVLFVNALLVAVLPWAFSAWVPFPVAWGAAIIWSGGIVCTYWTHGHWGGALAALLSALCLGALGRSLKGDGIGYGVLLGFSLGALSFVRPFEGLFLAVGMIGYFVWKERRKTRLVALAMPLVACLALWLYYNYRVTGDAFLHPYSLYIKTYVQKTLFWGQGNRTITYRHPEIERMLSSNGERLDLPSRVVKRISLFIFSLRPVVGVFLLLLGLGVAVRQRSVPALIAVGAAAISTTLSRYGIPHYVAPYFGFFGLLVAFGLQNVLQWEWRKLPLGFALASGLLFASLAGSGEAVIRMLRGERELRLLNVLFPLVEYPPYSLDFGPLSYVWAKQKTEARLFEAGGKHLAFVRYESSHDRHAEWVYNGADLDEARVIWARYYTEESRSNLRKHFADRACWIVYADQVPASLEPCPK